MEKKGVFFSASEIYQFAIRIEENGERFYRQVASHTARIEIKNLFSFLADEENEHRKFFQDLLSSLEKYQPPETYPGEYFEYLRAYADNLIFSQQMEKETSGEIAPSAALDFGIRREIDSIAYYLEVKNLVPEKQRFSIDRIIDEERKHFLKLSQLRKNLTGNN